VYVRALPFSFGFSSTSLKALNAPHPLVRTSENKVRITIGVQGASWLYSCLTYSDERRTYMDVKTGIYGISRLCLAPYLLAP
jgi:hypothetical protein